MTKRQRIGILGGNFNPPHYMHLYMADQVYQQLKLDKIYLMPEYLPPHKTAKNTIDAKHRLAMLELAVDNNPNLLISTLELERGGKSYTYDTMMSLKEENPDQDFYFIIGSDMVLDLPNWYQIDRLLELVNFVAVQRGDQAIHSPYPIQWLDIEVTSTLSSSHIRHLLGQGLSPNYLLPDPVLAYIAQHKLYQ